MNRFFTLTADLSSHSKLVLFQLIVKKTLGLNLSKRDIINLGCAHNKYSNVIHELQRFNAILKVEVEHKKRGRPSVSYNYVFEKHDEMTQLMPRNILVELEVLELEVLKLEALKLEGGKIRTSTKLVWSFFFLNQDEFGYVENISKGEIAKACGLKASELKTAIKNLKDMKLLSQPVTGCTIKEIATLNKNKSKPLDNIGGNNLKRSSTFRINNRKQIDSLYLIKLPLINRWLYFTDKKKLGYYTTIFLTLFREQSKRRDTLFLDLLRFENGWVKNVSNLNDEYLFLVQQPLQVFKYFDDVLFRLVTTGLLHIFRSEKAIIKPISEEDSYNLIFSPANFESMECITGNTTSKLISSFANILIHYILFHFYDYTNDSNLDQPLKFQRYSNWITNLAQKNKIRIELIKTPTKVWTSNITSIKNLVIYSNIDFSGTTEKSNSYVDFKDPNSHLKSGEYLFFQCVHNSFAHFYKSVITSE